LWQQSISHAFGPGVLVTKQGAAGNRTAAQKSAIPIATETAILLVTVLLRSTKIPQVEFHE
jgi:hypothetical protein